MKQNQLMPENAKRTNNVAASEARNASEANKNVEAQKNTEAARHELDERMITAVEAAADKKAIEPTMLDLRAVANFTDYFFITSGANARQVQAIADEIVERLKRGGEPARRVEGYNAAEWVLIDYGDFVVHIFEDRARRFYDLERLWREAARVELKPEVLSGERSSLTEQS